MFIYYSRKISGSLWNPKIPHGVNKRPPPVPTMNHMNLAHTLQTYFPTIHLISSSHLRLSYEWPLPFGLPTYNLYAFHIIPMHYVSHPFHPPLFDNPNNIRRRVRIMKLRNILSSPASCHFIPRRITYVPKHPILKHPQSVLFS
jgi:hypothetical protein